MWAGSDDAIVAAVLTFAVTGLTTLASRRGGTAAGRALVLSIWAVFALSFSGDAQTALELALAFLLGGAIATGILWLESRGTSHEPIEETERAARRSFDELIRSPLAAIALIRASTVGRWHRSGHPLVPRPSGLARLDGAAGDDEQARRG